MFDDCDYMLMFCNGVGVVLMKVLWKSKKVVMELMNNDDDEVDFRLWCLREFLKMNESSGWI